jgi:hypothetical protein
VEFPESLFRRVDESKRDRGILLVGVEPGWEIILRDDDWLAIVERGDIGARLAGYDCRGVDLAAIGIDGGLP